MNEDQEKNTAAILKIQETIHEIIKESDTIRIQIMKS